MLERVDSIHSYGTRRAGMGLYVSTRDHKSVGYRVPREWGHLPEKLRGAGSLQAFKKNSRAGFLQDYRQFVCGVRDCFVCGAAVADVIVSDADMNDAAVDNVTV